MATKKKAGLILGDTDMKRRYPEFKMASEIFVDEDKTLRLPCRIPAINFMMGGGIPYGTILELYGEESTGKSALAKDFVAVAQSLGGLGLWDDAECTFDGFWAKKLGIDLKKLGLLPNENIIEVVSDWIADTIVTYRAKLTKNEPIVLVIDSLAALESGANMEAADTDSGEDMGKRSKKIYQLLRKRMKVLAKYGAVVICINQIRKKVSSGPKAKYEDPDTTPGGMAMRFYASQRIGLYRGSKLKTEEGKKGKWVGNYVYVRTKKNKTAAPRDNTKAKFFFRDFQGKLGFDKYFGLEELLIEQGVIRKKAGRYYYKGEQIAYGQEAFEKVILTDEKLRRKLLAKLGVNTPSSLRVRLENETKNLYPVSGKKAKIKDDAEEQEEEENE